MARDEAPRPAGTARRTAPFRRYGRSIRRADALGSRRAPALRTRARDRGRRVRPEGPAARPAEADGAGETARMGPHPAECLQRDEPRLGLGDGGGGRVLDLSVDFSGDVGADLDLRPGLRPRRDRDPFRQSGRRAAAIRAGAGRRADETADQRAAAGSRPRARHQPAAGLVVFDVRHRHADAGAHGRLRGTRIREAFSPIMRSRRR